MLKGKTVVLGVTGSIAAYKIANQIGRYSSRHKYLHHKLNHQLYNRYSYSLLIAKTLQCLSVKRFFNSLFQQLTILTITTFQYAHLMDSYLI